MNIQTMNTPEKLHQAIVKLLESSYSHENLVETYNDARKCAIGFRGIYSALPALPVYKDNPLDGLQDVMDWCIKSSEVVDDIVSDLERQTIIAVISQLKKLKDFPSRVLSVVNSKLREQAQKEARAKVEKEYKNLNDKVSRLELEKMPLIDKIKVIGELQLEEQEILRRETKEIVQIYLSKDSTFKDRLSQLNSEINEILETLDKLIGSNTPTGKLLDIYCKLKDIPLQQQFDNVGYAYCPIDDLTDVICNGCNRLYTSVDSIIKTFEEIQTKAEQQIGETLLQADFASLPKNREDRSNKRRTSIFNKDFFNNFIKATIKHLPYVGPYLFDVIYGVDGVKSQKKESNGSENKKLTKERNHHYIKAEGDIIAGGDIIVGDTVLKNSSVKKATKNKGVINKWYQSRTIQAALITSGFMLVAAVLTTPLWTPFINKLFGGSGKGTKISTALETSGKSSPAIITGGPNSPVTINYNSPEQEDLQEKGQAVIGEGVRLTEPEKTEVNQSKPQLIIKARDKVISPEETGGEVNQPVNKNIIRKKEPSIQPEEVEGKSVYELGAALLEIFKPKGNGANSLENLPDLPVIRTYWKRDLVCSDRFLLPDRASEIGRNAAYVAKFSFYYEAKQAGKYGFTIQQGQDLSGMSRCRLTIGGVEIVKSGQEPVCQGVCNLEKGFHRIEFWLFAGGGPFAGFWGITPATFRVKILTPDAFDAVPLTKDMMLLRKE